MVRRNYEALVSGDGACAGCGEKSILRAVASVTEAYMRPLYHQKADRLRAQGRRVWKRKALAKLAGAQGAQRRGVRSCSARPFAHVIMGLGGENDEDTAKRIADYEAKHGPITDEQIIGGHGRGAAAGRLQSQGPAGHRWPPRQRHVRDDDGREHRLQHGLWLDAAVESASVSVDEFALPGRRDDLVAAWPNRVILNHARRSRRARTARATRCSTGRRT